MSKNKILKIVSAVVIVVLLGFVFYFFNRDGVNETDKGQSAVLTENYIQFEEADLLISRLNSVNSIKIDNAFFESDIFEYLTKYSNDIYQYEKGKENPFEPVDSSEIPIKTVQNKDGIIVVNLPDV